MIIEKEYKILKNINEVNKFDLEIYNLMVCSMARDYYNLFNEFEALRDEFVNFTKNEPKVSVPLDCILKDNSSVSSKSIIGVILDDYKEQAYCEYFSDRLTLK